MSANQEARQRALDGVLEAQVVTAALGEELFSVADVLSGSATLRRALTDSGSAESTRVGIVDSLFGGKLSDAAHAVLRRAVTLSWASPSAFVSAIERQGVRALMTDADAHGHLDDVEDQLFKVGRAVAANSDLRAALADRRVEVTGRQQLLDDVFTGKVASVVQTLARRAVLARQRTFDLTIDAYLQVAAEVRQRGIATIEVAQPLTDEQRDRLRAALSSQSGRDVTLNIVVNPAVIGGIRVSMGDEVIEGTVSARLADVRRKLS